MNRTVLFYRTDDGKCPVQQFLDSFPGKVAQKIVWVLGLLEDLEIVLSFYFKKLIGTEGIGSIEFSLAQMPIESFASLQITRLY